MKKINKKGVFKVKKFIVFLMLVTGCALATNGDHNQTFAATEDVTNLDTNLLTEKFRRGVIEKAMERYPDDYDMQLHYIERQEQAYAKLLMVRLENVKKLYEIQGIVPKSNDKN